MVDSEGQELISCPNCGRVITRDKIIPGGDWVGYCIYCPELRKKKPNIVYALGAFIFGAVTCIAYLVAFALYIVIFLTLITGVWGGFIWGIFWLFVGLGVSFLLVSLLSLPIRGIGALLMYLARGPEWKENSTAGSEGLYPQLTYPEPTEVPTYVGNSKTKVYHLSDCHHALIIGLENEVWFNSAKQATTRGFKPCKVCNPRPTSTRRPR